MLTVSVCFSHQCHRTRQEAYHQERCRCTTHPTWTTQWATWGSTAPQSAAPVFFSPLHPQTAPSVRDPTLQVTVTCRPIGPLSPRPNSTGNCYMPANRLHPTLQVTVTSDAYAPFRKILNSAQSGRFALILWRLVKGSFFCVF